MPQHILKTQIRQKILQQRNQLTSAELKKISRDITQLILAWKKFKSAKNIGIYHAFRNEVDLNSLWIAAHNLGKKTYFPVISSILSDKSMHFLAATPDQKLSFNQFNIKEPLSSAPSIPIEQLDCLFIPLVAFDKKGYRLGMGQGYYDRALANLSKKPICVGVAYSFQEIEALPREPWDVALDVVITEKQIKFFTLQP